MDNKSKNDQSDINKITFWGMAANIFLAALKIIFGVIVNSVSLIADGVHSFSDLFTDGIVLITSKAAKRPPDMSHPYGHGKIETLGSILIGIVLIAIGLGVGWSAISSLMSQKANYPGPVVVIIAGLSLVLKELLFQHTKKIALKLHSASLYANAWHHRSDAFSSLAVLIGGAASLLGFGYGDQLAGLVVGLMVIAVAGKIIFLALKELTEHSLDEEMIEVISEILNKQTEICRWHKLRTRKIGSELYVDMHVLVNPEMTVLESHDLTIAIEKKIEKKLILPVNILIHVEPC